MPRVRIDRSSMGSGHIAERCEVPPIVEQHCAPGLRSGGVLGMANALVAVVVVLLLWLLISPSPRELEDQLSDRVRDVHADLEGAGFRCSGLDVTEADIPSQVPSLVYAEGLCKLELPQPIEIRAYRSQKEVDAAVAFRLRSDSASFIVGNLWYMEVYPRDSQLAHKIAAALSTRVADNSQSIEVLAPE